MTQQNSVQKHHGAEIELLSFRLGEDEYCVGIMSVREIRGWTRPTPLPHAPPHLRGVINLRGTVLPVVDLSLRLGMDPVGGDARNVIIVVQINGHAVGLLVHAVSDILALESDDLQPPPETAGSDGARFISALAIVDERMVRILNLEAVLPDLTVEAA
ncbi:chemotaxis protein CheW [Paenirhodobacter enshiensis]|uniref:Chemotaxis protein CheW n=1 Tax=Paenirhodobacter enshiensis TaxID=1105367 RepID=A0A086XYV3_9RHOB|nr:chemotaxis protein CheW [Paenirhodobacter enshiensis]KFI27203.1 chemotaxis protein CheW [Paenirhodobacter enshiensis]